MAPNVDELTSILHYIETHPKKWTQGRWAQDEKSCGTSFCFGGHAVFRAGATILWSEPDIWEDEDGVSHTVINAEDCQFPGRDPEPIADAAQRVLGISDRQADYLFDGGNDLEQLQYVVARLTDVDDNWDDDWYVS